MATRVARANRMDAEGLTRDAEEDTLQRPAAAEVYIL